MENSAAFPQLTYEERVCGIGTFTDTDNPGMSKREYYAAKAMQGILASVIHEPDTRHYVNGSNLDVTLIAADAVNMADALLRELALAKTEA